MGLQDGEFYKAYINQNCPGQGGFTACYHPLYDALFLGTDPMTQVRRVGTKHVVGHEVGHMVSSRLSGEPTQAGYASDDCSGALGGPGGPPDPMCTQPQECRCDPHVVSSNDVHCLQSREFMNSAALEGFGHFYATALFNEGTNPGSFAYYKEFFTFGGTIPPPVEYEVITTPVAWLEGFCLPDAQSDRGTELDWQFFFYSIHRILGPDNYSFEDIGDVFANAPSSPTWSELSTSAQTTFPGIKGLWWEFAGDWFGINH